MKGKNFPFMSLISKYFIYFLTSKMQLTSRIFISILYFQYSIPYINMEKVQLSAIAFCMNFFAICICKYVCIKEYIILNVWNGPYDRFHLIQLGPQINGTISYVLKAAMECDMILIEKRIILPYDE